MGLPKAPGAAARAASLPAALFSGTDESEASSGLLSGEQPSALSFAEKARKSRSAWISKGRGGESEGGGQEGRAADEKERKQEQVAVFVVSASFAT